MARPDTIMTMSSSCSSSSSVALPEHETTTTSRSKINDGSEVMVVVTSFSSVEDSSSASPYAACSYSTWDMGRTQSLREEVEVFPTSENEPYYDVHADFAPSTWKEVLDYKSMPAFGVAVLATATIVVVHPLVFFAGAATAVWAVGVFQAVEQGYEYFSDGTFSRLFWDDKESGGTSSCAPPIGPIAVPQKSLPSKAEEHEQAKVNAAADNDNEDDRDEQHVHTSPSLAATKPVTNDNTSNITVRQETEKDNRNALVDEKARKSPSPAKVMSCPTPPSPAPFASTVVSVEEAISTYFPPLQTKVFEAVKFPGLHVLDFFSVFFSDNAPYSMKEFQKTMGDVDLIYGDWAPISEEDRSKYSLLQNEKHRDANISPLPRDTKVEQRVLTFKTLTKSYFGPAYASATKTQRVTKISKTLLVVENRTQLSDIPYGDRFCVCERWIMESVPNDKVVAKSKTGSKDLSLPLSSSDHQTHSGIVKLPMSYTTLLTVDVEVKMLKNCPWEAQIRKKTIPSMKEVLTSWCKMATTAMEVTEQKKIEKMQKNETAFLTARDKENNGQGSKHAILVDTAAANNVDVSGQKIKSQTLSSQASCSLDESNINIIDDAYQKRDQQYHLMALHQNRFQDIEKKIATGDLEWCSIEVQHSFSPEEGLCFTKVLDPCPYYTVGVDPRSISGNTPEGERWKEKNEGTNERIQEGQADTNDEALMSDSSDEKTSAVLLSPSQVLKREGCSSPVRRIQRSRFRRGGNHDGRFIIRLLPRRKKSSLRKSLA